MISIPLTRSGMAFISVGMAALNDVDMPELTFLVDTGSSRTTIPKSDLMEALGYTESYIQKNKIIIPEHKKPKMANGKRVDVYEIKAPRINISGHEMQPERNILTSDSIETLGLLLGLDILRHFKFTYDFDAIDNDAPYGRMFYEFRSSQIVPYTKMGEHFAYSFDDSIVDSATTRLNEE